MDKNQIRIVAVLAILLTVFSLFAFCMPLLWNSVFWLSYAFGVFAILVQLFVLKTAFGGRETPKSKYYGFPIARIGVLYLCVQLILSVVCMALSVYIPVVAAAAVFVVLCALAMIGYIGTDAMRDEVEQQELNTTVSTECMTRLRMHSASIASQCTDASAKKSLEALAEEFRFSDPVSNEALQGIENTLTEEMTRLQEVVAGGNVAQIADQCGKVSGVLAQRNSLCKLNKQK